MYKNGVIALEEDLGRYSFVSYRAIDHRDLFAIVSLDGSWSVGSQFDVGIVAIAKILEVYDLGRLVFG